MERLTAKSGKPPDQSITTSKMSPIDSYFTGGTQNQKQPTEDEIQSSRRFIAEDPNHNPDTVPSLVNLVLKHIIDNFGFNYSALPFLNPDQLQYVLDSLPVDIPLKVVASTISDEAFWQRMTLSRWSVVDVMRHGNSWKRAFFEKHLEQTVHEFVPGRTYPVWIEEAVQLGAPYIRRLDIKELLPPAKLRRSADSRFGSEQAARDLRLNALSNRNGPEEADGFDENDLDDFDGDDLPEGGEGGGGGGDEDAATATGAVTTQVDHLDLGEVIAKLDHLTHLSVQYRVRNVGLDFEWSQFQFTGQDCLMFSRAVKAHTSLRILELVNSRVDCERCRVLIGHLLDHPSLVVLNLSHNVIGDWGARALGKLVNGRSRLEVLDLTNNTVGPEGGEALSHALAKGAGTLKKLNLRLNRIRDEGASSIARSLLRNTTLRELNLAANGLGDATIHVFGQVLTHNSTLQKLDLTNNIISANAGKKFQECIASNQTLIYLDLRFTGIPQVFEFTLQQGIEANDNRYRMEEEKDSQDGRISLPGLISVAVNEVKPEMEKRKLRPSIFVLP